MTKKATSLRAFIAAPAGESLTVLIRELGKRDVEGYTAYDLPPATVPIATHLEQAIKKADLFIAVVPEAASHNVFFELGMAQAMKKPLLVLVSPKFGAVPSDIAGTLYLRIDPEDREALSFALDECINRLAKAAPRPRKVKKEEGYPLGEEADRFLSEIRNKRMTEAELEKLVAKILRAAGAEAVIESHQREGGTDLAIWSDALQPIGGNPILVEVKDRIPSRAELLGTLNRIEVYREKSGAKLALLIVGAAMVFSGPIPFTGGVLAVLLSDLLDKLRTKPLAKAIMELRNESVHAGGK